MVINQLENNKYISEGNKWLEILKKKAYLELAKSEKAAVKRFYEKLRDEVKAYNSPNASLAGVYEELTKVLDSKEGFFWEYAD